MKNRAEEQWGMLQVFTGNGKGKTTAAFGTALRAYVCGKRVGFVYFDKGGSHYSERSLVEFLETHALSDFGKIDIVATGLDRIDSETGRFRFGVTDEDKREATRGILAAEKMFGDEYDLIVLDEFNSSISLGMITETDARALIDKKPKNLECICTGRGAPEWLVEKADLVTDMQLVKHYFYHGAAAREGLDY